MQGSFTKALRRPFPEGQAVLRKLARNARSILPDGPGKRLLVIGQDALRRTIEVVILATPQAPQEGQQTDKAEQKSHGDKKQELVHAMASVWR